MSSLHGYHGKRPEGQSVRHLEVNLQMEGVMDGICPAGQIPRVEECFPMWPSHGEESNELVSERQQNLSESLINPVER